MNKTEIERYFQEYIFCFIKTDIQREIDLAAKGEGGGNFLVVLGLLCYTEFMLNVSHILRWTQGR